MVTIGSRGIQHLHKKKRQKKLKSFKEFINSIAYLAAIFGPLIAIPQLWKIWYFQDATGVSILTWAGYMSGGVFWMAYGVINKEKPIVIMNVLWLIFALFIVIGAFIYG